MTTSRKVFDCRLFPADIPCEFAIAGEAEEVLSIAVEHAVEDHEFRDTPALREQLRSLLRDEAMKKVA